MLHLVKLCVGCDSIPELAQWQARKGRLNPPLRHQTRNMPRRAAEIAGKGSIYWVMGGAIVVRQRILEIIADRWDDGTPCAGLVLEPLLVPTLPRPMRPFQGWRYLAPEDAPADRAGGIAKAPAPSGDMPAAMQRELRELGLL